MCFWVYCLQKSYQASAIPSVISNQCFIKWYLWWINFNKKWNILLEIFYDVFKYFFTTRRGHNYSLKRSVELASEKGASNWLTVLPLKEHSFSLHKTAFHDAITLRYVWDPARLPQHFACVTKFTVEHSFTCPKGGFPSIRHNDICDFTASLLTEVCHEVDIEPYLQPITGEKFTLALIKCHRWCLTWYFS